MFGLLTVLVAAPLTTGQALGLLETSTAYKVAPACKQSVDLILHGTANELSSDAVAKQTHLSVRCVSPHYPRVASAIDANASRCAVSGEECQAWLVHARSSLLDAIADDESTAADFAHVMSAMTAIGFHDSVDEGSAARALASAARLSASYPKDLYVQRISLAAWMLIPGGSGEIADVLKRAMDTGPDDRDILSAVVILSERVSTVDMAQRLIDNVVESAKTPTERGYGLYLSGCVALFKNDKVAAHDYFSSALKSDPFEARYGKAVKETAADSTAEATCNLVFSPFSQALKTAIANKR